LTQASYFSNSPIDADALEETVRRGNTGAVVTFRSVVRPDRTPEGEIAHLLFEAQEPAASASVAKIFEGARSKWPGYSFLFRHRLGAAAVGEASVFLAVLGPDQKDAFAACHFLIDQLRLTAPIEKKEVFKDGRARHSTASHEVLIVSDGDETSIPMS